MSDPEFLKTPHGRELAFHRTAGEEPGVIFLGGFRSDMTGTKALHLESWAKRTGRAFTRFDYSGHGSSSGEFLAGCIGDWAEDAAAMLAATAAPQILVGSSMGGWIALLLTRRFPADRITGLVTVAAAPDFTEDSMWAEFSEGQRSELRASGQVALPSDYSEEPYIITRRLIEDGRRHLVLRDPLELPFPARMLQGTADTDVATSVALRLLNHAHGPDIRLTLVKDADHRFSSPRCLDLITSSVEEVLSSVRQA